MAKQEIKWETKEIDLQNTQVKLIKVEDENVEDETMLLIDNTLFVREWEIGDLISLFGDLKSVCVFLNAYKGKIQYREFAHEIGTFDDNGKEIKFATKGIARNYMGYEPSEKAQNVIERKTEQILFG